VPSSVADARSHPAPPFRGTHLALINDPAQCPALDSDPKDAKQVEMLTKDRNLSLLSCWTGMLLHETFVIYQYVGLLGEEGWSVGVMVTQWNGHVTNIDDDEAVVVGFTGRSVCRGNRTSTSADLLSTNIHTGATDDDQLCATAQIPAHKVLGPPEPVSSAKNVEQLYGLACPSIVPEYVEDPFLVRDNDPGLRIDQFEVRNCWKGTLYDKPFVLEFYQFHPTSEATTAPASKAGITLQYDGKLLLTRGVLSVPTATAFVNEFVCFIDSKDTDGPREVDLRNGHIGDTNICPKDTKDTDAVVGLPKH